MKPQKLFKKVMLLALVLAVLGGVLVTSAIAAETATSAIPSTPTSVYNMLNGGITFETYTSDYGAYTYMYDVTGMYLTDQYGNESRTAGISIVDVDTTEDGVDYELKLTENAYFLNGYTSSSATAPNPDKYARSQALLDLLFSTGGPQKFSLSLDMTFHGQRDVGTNNNVEWSSDSNVANKAYLYSYYRGTSAITFNGTWLFKATSANLPVYSVDKNNPVKAGGQTYYPYIAGTAVAEDMKDRGYLYGFENSIAIHASAEDSYNKVSGDHAGDYANYGNTSSCVSPEYMTSENVVTYKLGEPVRLRMEFDKTATAGKVTINVYASTDGNPEVLLTTKTDITIGNSAMKGGLRLFDKRANVSLDNIAVDIEDCGNDHDSVWVDHTTSMTDVKYNGEVVSTKIVSTCKTCNTEYRTSYTNPIFVAELRDDASLAVMEGSRVDGANTDQNKRLGYYLFKNTGLGINHVDDIYDGDGNPIVLSLDLKVEALPKDANCQNGKSLLTWKPNADAYFYQFIRLYPGGEIRMVNSDGRWNYSNSENAKLAVKETPYEIDIIFEPDTGAYRLFIDGELIGQSVCTKLKSDMLNSDNTTYPRLRVGDSDAGAYTVSDLVVTEMVEAAEHAHSYVFADEKTVASNDTTLTCAYTCYCGEEAVSEINGVVVDNLYNAYADTATVSGLPTEGDFWISTEYNVRNADAVTADTDILAIGGTVLVKNDAAVTAVTTEKYAVRVCYTGENAANVEIYRNGTLVDSKSVTFEGDASVLTLGDADVSGVRFNNTKIVTLGHTDTPIVPNYRDARLLPCYHEIEEGTELADDTPCVKCGELISTLEHVHSDDWADASSTITLTDTTLSRTYTCYCGEENLVAEIDSVVIDRLYDAYQDTATIEEIPTEGDFWVATYYNIRTANAVTADSAILTLGDTVLVKNADAVADVMTKSYAAYVNYINADNGIANVAIYCDGELVDELEGVTVGGDRTTLTLGDANVSGVRFLNTKIVTIGDVEIPVVPEFKSAGLVACYHEAGALIGALVNDGDKLLYHTTCVKCGEKVAFPANVYTGGSYNYASANEDASVDGVADIKGVLNYNLPTEVVSTADNIVEPYQLDFTLTFTKFNDTMSSLYNDGSGRSVFNFDGNFSGILRVFPVSDGNGGYKTDVVDLKTKNSSPVDIVTNVALNQPINFSFVVTPETRQVDIYVNGKLVHTRPSSTFPMDATDTKVRFNDGSSYPAGGYTKFNISNLRFARLVDEHTHTDKWAPETTISVTENTISRTYTCYCGETVTAEIENVVIDKLNDEYQDFAVITGLPTQGEFWITTDYNVRSSNVITSGKLNSAIISIGDTVILKNTKAITFPVVTGYALKVEYTDVERGEANVTVFCDGKKVGDATEAVLTGDTATLTLGDKNVSDVRFINTKVVTLGEVDTAAVPTFTAAGLMPCNHSAFNQTDCTFVYGNDFEDADSKYRKLYKSYVCSGCGETFTEQVDNMFNEVVTSDSKTNSTIELNTKLKNGGTVKNIGSNRNIIADNTIGKANAPFWIRFTIDVTEITQDNVENVYYKNKTNKTVQTGGRTFFGTYHDTGSYQHLLRSFVVKNEDYDSTVEGSLPYRTDITQLRIGNGSSGALNPTGSFVTYLEAGKSYDFALYFVPESGDLHVYLDGKFQAKGNVGTMNEDTTKCYGFRFLDAGSGKYNFGNFYMYRDSTYDAHVHSDEWDINSTGKGVLITDTQLSPYYTCYCGEKVFYGDISTLVNDNIADIYNGLGNVTLNSADAGMWISSDINIRNSVVDGSLITLGENSLLSIKDGKLMSGAKDTGIVASANSSYVTAVKIVSATAYELYVNGKFAASGALTDVGTALTLGDESFGENVRFRYNKVVKIDNDDTTPVLVPKYNDGGVINSCYHEANGNAEDRTVSLEDGVLKYTYVCAKCGERVYTKLNKDLFAVDGKDYDFPNSGSYTGLTESDLEAVTLTGAKYLYVKNGALLKGAEPYWLTFDLTPNSFTSYNSGKADKTNTGEVDSAGNQRTYKGYGVITIQPTATYTSELRLIMDGWEEENAPKEADGYMSRGKMDGVVELKVLHTDLGTTTFRYAPTAAYLKVGETVSIALRVDPSTGAYDVYINGVYIVSSNRGVATTESTPTEASPENNPRIRFHESSNFTYSNIKLMSYVHECEYTQEVIDEKYFATHANCAEGARYYKSCVCGEFANTADTFVGGTELDSSVHAYILENTAFKFLKSKATATDAAVYYKSCGCGLIGEDTFTYGEPHTTHTFAQVVDAKYAAEGEANTYYKSCLGCGEVGTDTFTVTVPTVTFGDYDLEGNVTLDGNISVIEMKAKFTPVGTAVMYHPLVKILGTQGEELELLYVEASTGALAIKLADGSYSAFYGAVEQEAKCLNGAEDTKIAIIYDDANGLVRYYVEQYIPYYYENGARLANEVVPGNLDTFKDAEASSINVITASEGVAATASISKTYNINDSGTAEILALQEHETGNGVRVLAGVDMLWYSSVGFDIEVYENKVGKGVKTVYTNKVFESVEAEGETVYASLFTNYEFNYFAAITVTGVDIVEGNSYYIIMTPFTGAGDKIYRGESVKINVTADSYEFATEEAGE